MIILRSSLTESRPVGVVVDAAGEAALVEPGAVSLVVVLGADQADRTRTRRPREVFGGRGSNEAAPDHGQLVRYVGHCFRPQNSYLYIHRYANISSPRLREGAQTFLRFERNPQKRNLLINLRQKEFLISRQLIWVERIRNEGDKFVDVVSKGISQVNTIIKYLDIYFSSGMAG